MFLIPAVPNGIAIQKVEAQEIPSKEVVLSAPEYIEQEATKMGVDPDVALYIWKNEGRGNLRAIGDMDITCGRTGKPVRARGGWQITECFYPQVSDACAFDLKCSTAVALPLLKTRKSCLQQFSTCPL